jgi:hypothetical protein
MSLLEKSDEYLIDLYVQMARAHNLGSEILKGSRRWTGLQDRKYYLEFVGNEILRVDCIRGSQVWNDILEKNARLLQRALKIAEAYATQCNEDIMYDYHYRTYDFHIWLALASKIEPVRLQKIKEQAVLLDEKELLRERQEAFLEMYSDF